MYSNHKSFFIKSKLGRVKFWTKEKRPQHTLRLSAKQLRSLPAKPDIGGAPTKESSGRRRKSTGGNYGRAAKERTR